MTPFDPDTFVTAFGINADCLRGIRGESCLGSLGRANLDRLLKLLGASANEMLSGGPERHTELLQVPPVRERLESILASSSFTRPLLPRLRAEFFHAGDEVAVLFPGPGADWHAGTVLAVEKSHKPEWNANRATRGFYWRVTALLRDGRTLAFSTTEPRVVLRAEFLELQALFELDLRFLAVFCENGERDWPPVWEIEAGRSAPASVNLAKWLHRGRVSAELRG